MDRKALLAAMEKYAKRRPRKGRKGRGAFRRDGKYGSAVVRG